MEITYTTGVPITVDQFIDVLRRSTLAERRPVEDRQCMAGMLEHGNLLVCAWARDELVGVARSVTDFHYCCYLSDLAGASLNQLSIRSERPHTAEILPVTGRQPPLRRSRERQRPVALGL